MNGDKQMDFSSAFRLPSGRDIVEQHRIAFKKELPSTGQKRFAPSWYSWDEIIELNDALHKRESLIKEVHIEKSSQISVAEWIPGSGHARVIKNRGKLHEYYGYTNNTSDIYLYPEEALFLLESNVLYLTKDDVPLSVEAAYYHLFGYGYENDLGCTFAQYQVYSHLSRLGYKLRRYEHLNSSSGSVSFVTGSGDEFLPSGHGRNDLMFELPNSPELNYIVDIDSLDPDRLPPDDKYIGRWKSFVRKKPVQPLEYPMQEGCDDVIITHTVRTNFTDFEDWPYVPEKHFLLLTDLTGDDVEIPEYNVIDLSHEDTCSIVDKLPNYVNSSILKRPDYRLCPLRVKPSRPFYKVVGVGSAKRELAPLIQSVVPVKKRRQKERIKPLVSNSPSSFKKVYSSINIFKNPPLCSGITNILASYEVYLPSVSFRKSDPNLPNYRLIVGTNEEPPPFEEILALLEMNKDKVDLLYASTNGDSISFMQYFPLNLNCDI